MKDLMKKFSSSKFKGSKGIILGGTSALDQNYFTCKEFRNRNDIIDHENTLKEIIERHTKKYANTSVEPLKMTPFIEKKSIENYKCPICSKVNDYDTTVQHIRTCAVEACSDDPSIAISTMFTVNEFNELQSGLPIIKKYIENVIQNPTDEKFHKIRLENKVFANLVQPLLCHQQVFSYLGFKLKEFESSGVSEQFYFIENPNIDKLSNGIIALELKEGIFPVFCRSYRKYFATSDPKEFDDENDDLLTTTVGDLQSEVQRQKESIADRDVLKLRGSDSGIAQNQTVYIKIRFPDQSILEASFGAKEKLLSVYEFIVHHLLDRNLSFILHANQVAVSGSRQGHNSRLMLLHCNAQTLDSLSIKDNISVNFELLSNHTNNFFS